MNYLMDQMEPEVEAEYPVIDNRPPLIRAYDERKEKFDDFFAEIKQQQKDAGYDRKKTRLKPIFMVENNNPAVLSQRRNILS